MSSPAESSEKLPLTIPPGDDLVMEIPEIVNPPSTTDKSATSSPSNKVQQPPSPSSSSPVVNGPPSPTTADQTNNNTKEPSKKKSIASSAKKFIGRFFGGDDTPEETYEMMLEKKENQRKQKVALMTGQSYYGQSFGGVEDESMWKQGWKDLSVDHEDQDYNAMVSALNSTEVTDESTKKKDDESDEEEKEGLTDSEFSDSESEEEDNQTESKNQTFMVSQENEYVQRFIQERREMHSKFSIGEIDRVRLYGQIIDYAMSSVESNEISDRILHVIAFKDRIMFVDEYDHLVEVKFDKKKELRGYFVKKIFLCIPYAYECYVVLENPDQGTFAHYVIDIDKQLFEQSGEKETVTFDFYKFDPKIFGSSQKTSLFDGSNYVTAMGFPHSIVKDDITTRKVLFMAVAPHNSIYKVDYNVEGEEYDWHINFKKTQDKIYCEEVYSMETLYSENRVIIHAHLQGFGIDSIEFAEVKERNEFMAFVTSVAGIAIFTGNGEITDIFDRYSPDQSSAPVFRNFDEETDSHLDDRPKIMHKSILKIYNSQCFACITAKHVVFGRIYSDSQKTIDRAGKIQHKNPNDIPVDIELNSFHIFICYKDEFHVIMQPAYLPPTNSRYSLLSKVVYGVRIIGALGVKIDRTVIDKSREESNQSIFVFNSSKLYRLSIEDQAKGFWRLFLDAALEIEDQDMESIKSEYFKKALKLSVLDMDTQEENRMAIYSAKADHHFKKGDYNTAALDYARTNRNFEEVAMKFMEADPEDKKNGLYNYLYYMLHRYVRTLI